MRAGISGEGAYGNMATTVWAETGTPTYEKGTISESAQRVQGGISSEEGQYPHPRHSELAVLADLHANSYRSLDAGGQREFRVHRLPALDEVLGGALRGNVDPRLRPDVCWLGSRKRVRQRHYQ